MRAYVIDWLTSLLWWAPLAALVLVSLAIVALKRRSDLPNWLARLVAPPFYLVSLPVATLIVGADMLGVYFLYIIAELLSPDGFSWNFRLIPFFLNPIPAFLLPLIPIWAIFSDYAIALLLILATIVFFAGFWSTTFFSGYLLWRTVWRASDKLSSLRVASPLLRGLLLLFCFAWTFSYLFSYIGWLTVPIYGPASPG